MTRSTLSAAMASRQRARPTIYDVAREAGVSTATVSRALNDTGQIAPATRKAIEEAVERLGYERIAHVSGAPELGISAERLTGYRDALGAARVRHDVRLVATGRFTENGG